MSTMTTTTTREVTDEEVLGMIQGTGALGWEWWRSVKTEKRDGVAGYLFRVDDPGNTPKVLAKWVSTQDIATAAGEHLSSMAEDGALCGDHLDALNEDLGYLDAIDADNVLQRAVLGAVFYS